VGAERRQAFRLTITMPVGIAFAASAEELVINAQTVNISAGGIGFVTSAAYDVGDLLALVLDLGEDPRLRLQARVLHVDPLPRQRDRRRIGARFTELARHDEDRLVRWILRRQAERLKDHYSV